MCKAIAEVRFDTEEWREQVRKARVCAANPKHERHERHGFTDAEWAGMHNRCPRCNEARILNERSA